MFARAPNTRMDVHKFTRTSYFVFALHKGMCIYSVYTGRSELGLSDSS